MNEFWKQKSNFNGRGRAQTNPKEKLGEDLKSAKHLRHPKNMTAKAVLPVLKFLPNNEKAYPKIQEGSFWKVLGGGDGWLDSLWEIYCIIIFLNPEKSFSLSTEQPQFLLMYEQSLGWHWNSTELWLLLL